MIKYAICPSQFRINEKTERNVNKWVEEVFDLIERTGLENNMHNIAKGQQLTILNKSIGKDSSLSCYFHCTGIKKGYFTQKVITRDWSYFSRSSEFTYE